MYGNLQASWSLSHILHVKIYEQINQKTETWITMNKCPHLLVQCSLSLSLPVPVVWSWGPACSCGCQTQPVCARTSMRPAGYGSSRSSTGHAGPSPPPLGNPGREGHYVMKLPLQWQRYSILKQNGSGLPLLCQSHIISLASMIFVLSCHFYSCFSFYH